MILTAETYTIIFACILLIVIGYFGNIVTIIIFRQKEFQKQSTSVYFICLSIVNMILISYAPLIFFPDIWTINNLTCKIFFVTQITVVKIQSWILVICSFDRLLMVTVPHNFLFRKKLSFQLAIIAIILIILIASLFPYFMFFGLVNNIHNETVCLFSPDSPSWVWIYGKLEFALLKTIFPFLIMIISSFLMFWKVLIQKKKLKGNNACFQKEYQMVISLVFVDLLFLVLHLPNAIFTFIYNKDDGHIVHSFLFSILSIIGCSYSVFVFIIFIFANKVYRDLFHKCLKTCCCQRNLI